MLPDILTTPRLQLRRWDRSFAPAYAVLCSDPEVMTYISEGLPYSPERAYQSQEKIYQHWAVHGVGMYGLFTEDHPDLIGIAGLATADYLVNRDPMPEIGWRLAKRYWGKGLAHEATTAVLEEVKKQPSIPELCAVIQPANQRSQTLAARLGFTFSGEDIDEDFQNLLQIWHLRLQKEA